MNKIILMGRVTRDPDVRYSADNKANARFSLRLNVDLNERERTQIFCFLILLLLDDWQNL